MELGVLEPMTVGFNNMGNMGIVAGYRLVKSTASNFLFKLNGG